MFCRIYQWFADGKEVRRHRKNWDIVLAVQLGDGSERYFESYPGESYSNGSFHIQWNRTGILVIDFGSEN